MSVLTEKPNQGSAHVLNSIWAVVHERGLKVGDQLPSIRELADRLEVKRTAVRDALLKAESLGMVRVMPRAGAFLKTLVPGSSEVPPTAEASLLQVFHQALSRDEHNLFHLLDARRLIEVELAGRAAEHRRLEDLLPVRLALEALLHLPLNAPRADYVDCDIRFHIEIARPSGNQVLFAVQRTLMELLRPHLNDVHQDLQRWATTDRSHIAIYEALVAGDSQRARSEMREHLSLAYDSMLRDIQEVPPLNGVSTSHG
jgi:GntR family transcriptional repressor for pyruvate dehydrogenase complex